MVAAPGRGPADGTWARTRRQAAGWALAAPSLSLGTLVPVPAAAAAEVADFDFDGDGYADLAVGVPGEDLGGASYDAGAVTVLYGSATGLTGKGSQTWTQDSPGIKGRGEQSDYFGRYLRIADFGHGRGADLAAAGDGESLGPILYAGEVNVLYGSGRGLTSTDQLWSQDSPGIEGKAQSPDFFGVL